MKIVGWILVGVLVIVAMAAAIVIVWNSWAILNAIIDGAKTLEPSTYVPLTVTVLTASLGLGATLFSQNRVRKREIEAAHRERKIEIYLEFLKTFESIMVSTKPELKSEELDENLVTRKLLEIRTKAVLWGSAGVLRSLGNLQHAGADGGRNIVDVFDDLQREMRKDIGLSNSGLEKDFFVKLILKDPGEINQLREQTAQRIRRI